MVGEDLHIVSSSTRKAGAIAHDAHKCPRVQRGCFGLRSKLKVEPDSRMLAEVTSYSRCAHKRGNSEPAQLIRRPNAKAHQDCRRVNGPGTEDHFSTVDELPSPRGLEVDTDNVSTVKRDTIDQSVADDPQVRAAASRLEIGVVG